MKVLFTYHFHPGVPSGSKVKVRLRCYPLFLVLLINEGQHREECLSHGASFRSTSTSILP